VSVDFKSIINECREKVLDGAKEIVFLGQNVNSYLYEGFNFSHLLKEAAGIEGLKRIRFMTNHPKDLSDDLIETIATENKICRHIHLPMQSASNKILLAMNRKYTFEHYAGLISKLRNRIPDISITTDIITGFPTESLDDFEQTLEAVKNIRFGGLYVFRYSPRPNTKAALMADDVSTEEKQRRLAIILKESNDISEQIVSQMKGKVCEVLTEKFENGILEARTGSGRKVFIKGDRDQTGKLVNVLIKETKINALFGDMQ
jgi:tRNA-2-methylthio-N6-dimethylallyladenosine synthase